LGGWSVAEVEEGEGQGVAGLQVVGAPVDHCGEELAGRGEVAGLGGGQAFVEEAGGVA
jgi:hypothetical protein